MQLTQKEKELLANTLKDRYDQSHKYNVGDMELGSTVIVRVDDETGVEEEAYAILIVYRQNKKDTMLASMGVDNIDLGYRFKHNEQVAPLLILNRG